MYKPLLFSAVAALAVSAFSFSSCSKACDSGYEGKRCDVPIRDKFLGIWSATDEPGTLTYTDTIFEASDILTVYLSRSFAANYFNKPIKATVSGTTITIERQQPDNNKKFVEGTGTVNEEAQTLNWNYNLIDAVDSPEVVTSYTGVWKK